MKLKMVTKKDLGIEFNLVIDIEEILENMPNSTIKTSELEKKISDIDKRKLKLILDYLDRANKILLIGDTITWIHNKNKSLMKDIERGLEL